MTLYIGHKENGDPLVHLTGGNEPEEQVKGDILPTTVFHSDIPYLSVIGQYPSAYMRKISTLDRWVPAWSSATTTATNALKAQGYMWFYTDFVVNPSRWAWKSELIGTSRAIGTKFYMYCDMNVSHGAGTAASHSQRQALYLGQHACFGRKADYSRPPTTISYAEQEYINSYSYNSHAKVPRTTWGWTYSQVGYIGNPGVPSPWNMGATVQQVFLNIRYDKDRKEVRIGGPARDNKQIYIDETTMKIGNLHLKNANLVNTYNKHAIPGHGNTYLDFDIGYYNSTSIKGYPSTLYSYWEQVARKQRYKLLTRIPMIGGTIHIPYTDGSKWHRVGPTLEIAYPEMYVAGTVLGSTAGFYLTENSMGFVNTSNNKTVTLASASKNYKNYMTGLQEPFNAVFPASQGTWASLRQGAVFHRRTFPTTGSASYVKHTLESSASSYGVWQKTEVLPMIPLPDSVDGSRLPRPMFCLSYPHIGTASIVKGSTVSRTPVHYNKMVNRLLFMENTIEVLNLHMVCQDKTRLNKGWPTYANYNRYQSVRVQYYMQYVASARAIKVWRTFTFSNQYVQYWVNVGSGNSAINISARCYMYPMGENEVTYKIPEVRIGVYAVY